MKTPYSWGIHEKVLKLYFRKRIYHPENQELAALGA
jgi:hypothetical protein